MFDLIIAFKNYICVSFGEIKYGDVLKEGKKWGKVSNPTRI